MDHILSEKILWNLGQRVYTVLVSPADSTFDCSWLGLLSIHCRFRHVEANLLGPMPTRAYLVKGQLEDTTWGCRMTGLVWLGHTWNAVVFACRMIESLALHQIGHSLRLLFIIGILSCFFFWQHLCSPRKMQICIYYAFYKLSSSHTKTGGLYTIPNWNAQLHPGTHLWREASVTWSWWGSEDEGFRVFDGQTWKHP